MIENRDRAMMARAVQLAWRGRYSTHPNPRVGCVIAREIWCLVRAGMSAPERPTPRLAL